MMRIASVAAILLLSGCFGYSTRSLLPSHLKTVGIAPVVNSTTQPGLAEQLNDALPLAFNSDRNLRVTNVEAANLVLDVAASNYQRDAASYTGDQAVSAYRVTISVQVDVRDQVRDEDFYSGPASASITYDPGLKTEEQAAAEAVNKLAAEIVRQVLIAW